MKTLMVMVVAAMMIGFASQATAEDAPKWKDYMLVCASDTTGLRALVKFSMLPLKYNANGDGNRKAASSSYLDPRQKTKASAKRWCDRYDGLFRAKYAGQGQR